MATARSTFTRSGSSRQQRDSDAAAAAAGAAAVKLTTPLAPPHDPEACDTDEQWHARQLQQSEDPDRVDTWHHLPLVLVALPPLGAIFHGRAENWTDGLILVLVCFYLYHLVRVPWDLYYASRSRRVIEPALSTAGEDAALEEDPVVRAHRRAAQHTLRQAELVALLMTVLAPALGAYLLYLARGMLSDPDRYINTFTVSLFALATAVKPLLHLTELFKRRSLYYQELVHYPSTRVHLLQRKIDRLERDVAHLVKAFATKEELRTLHTGVDGPLTQLTKAVRRYERKEETLRLTAEERFALLDAKLEEALQDSLTMAEVVERLKREHAEAASPLQTLLRVINHLVGQSSAGGSYDKKGSRTVHWYERGPLWYLFLPVSISSLAVEWIASKGLASSPSSGFEAARPARVAFE